jgi:hypothetical protein
MASPSSGLIESTNARLAADPRYQAALQQYRQAVAAAPPKPTVNDLRSNDSSDVAEGETRPEVLAAKQELGKTVAGIVKEYNLPGQPQAWLYDPDRGAVVYEEDHSLRNIGIAFGAIALGGALAGVAGSGAAGGAALPSSTVGLAGSGFGAVPATAGTIGLGGTAAGVGAGVAGGTAATGAGVGAAGTGGTLAATSTAPAVGGFATGTAASGAVPAASAGGSAAGTGGVMGKLGSLGWSNLIGAGTQLGGAYLQSRATGKAAELEAQAQKDALDFLKARDARDYADQAPYRALGANSANSLGHYLGFAPTPEQAPIPAAPGVNVGDPRLGTRQPVTMRYPKTGEVGQVKPQDVAHWQKLGAEIIGSPVAPPSASMPPASRGMTLSDALTHRMA